MANENVFLQFNAIKKSYDHKQLVVKDFNLSVAAGEFVTLLGPSGSGKTSVLMLVAGFEGVTSGDILINGVSIKCLAPHQRNIGMVFQNYALFPHMTVSQNLAYPLKVRKWPKKRIQSQINTFLEMIELTAFAKRYPSQLSGGQKQRVALARALIFEPSLVLMDEPLGALDKKLREQMQFEITRLHKQLQFTVLYVTHDQEEALTMSDRIAVFSEGIVQQCAKPYILYEHPDNAFVADFIGENNMIKGICHHQHEQHADIGILQNERIHAQTTARLKPNQACVISIRPEKISIKRLIEATPESIHHSLTATFYIKHYVGGYIRYYFQLSDGSTIMVKSLNVHHPLQLEPQEKVQLIWSIDHAHAFIIDSTT
ncbi:ABC transporter ATP-binding protein [Shewanella surugensis]|uniref:Spermidine/putrescine import ATP-binding protein PotA n=1 Tax=Shewanella surugensis TaxID=212020 RepID=A0ABT0LD23_9GAMM|nr:ABC transporter ATP-binding protein [Shewanella surugensis]MCL1125469.1 ABC transporter ATP-binding protein [Shewanella surugensis]